MPCGACQTRIRKSTAALKPWSREQRTSVTNRRLGLVKRFARIAESQHRGARSNSQPRCKPTDNSFTSSSLRPDTTLWIARRCISIAIETDARNQVITDDVLPDSGGVSPFPPLLRQLTERAKALETWCLVHLSSRRSPRVPIRQFPGQNSLAAALYAQRGHTRGQRKPHFLPAQHHGSPQHRPGGFGAYSPCCRSHHSALSVRNSCTP
jgi:hypothetical protein